MRKPDNILRKGLMGLVVGAGALMNGCEEPRGNYNDNQQQSRNDAGQAGLDLLQFTLGLYGVTGDGTPQQRNAAGYTAHLIGEEKRNDAIRQSGTIVNVYNGQPQGQGQVYNSKSFSTAFNYWNDRNGNNLISPDEFVGAAKIHSLSKEDQIIFSSLIRGHKGEHGEFYIGNNLNGNWQKIYSDEGLINEDEYLALFKLSSQKLKEIGARGTCLINFWAGNDLVDNYRITFVD